jgi:hypothetical protein
MVANIETDKADPASKWERYQQWLKEPYPKTKTSALAHFRQTAAYLSDPDIQEMIESEARRQMWPEINATNELLARSSVLGQNEILR